MDLLSNPTVGKLDLPLAFTTFSVITATALAVMGVLGAIGMMHGTAYGLTLLGASVVMSLWSFGWFGPAALITIPLAICGLTGTLPFASVGLGIAITMSVYLFATGFFMTS